jgi:ethanolamine utilization protein EutS
MIQTETKETKQRIIQELVPGRQVTLAHVIASPDPVLYGKIGMNGVTAPADGAIGIMTVSPGETAVIMADIALKAAGVYLHDLDHTSGSLIIGGTVSEVDAALHAVLTYVQDTLHYEVCNFTKT